MQAEQPAYTLLALAVLFAVFGALFDLWFYAIGGTGLALYLTWRYLAFRSLIDTLRVDVTRRADKAVVGRHGRVTIEITVSANRSVHGWFADVTPPGVSVVEGTTAVMLAVGPGTTYAWQYTLEAISREALVIEHSALTLDNGLFRETVRLETVPVAVERPSDAVSVEGGVSGRGAPTRAETSVHALYRTRQAGAGYEVSHLRPFATGDPLKHVNWKASARLNQLMTKEFVAEMDSAIASSTAISLVVDQSASMGRGRPGATALDFAVAAAGHFVRSAITRGNRISLVTYDDQGVSTSLAAGDSVSHISSVARSLNRAVPPAAPAGRRRIKSDVTGSDVARVKRHFAATDREEIDDDVRQFRHIILYLYTHSEGYLHSLRRSPAFNAITTSMKRSPSQSAVVLVSDLENDLSAVTEGIRLATRRGKHVYVVALFADVFEHVDDPLMAVEDLYARYEVQARRLNTLRHLPNVTVIEATSPETLQPALKEAKLAPT
ncbi:MAG: DUF58 domain-containing protein [Halobacteriota archaeon]